jgi:hypothetical protein
MADIGDIIDDYRIHREARIGNKDASEMSYLSLTRSWLIARNLGGAVQREGRTLACSQLSNDFFNC